MRRRTILASVAGLGLLAACDDADQTSSAGSDGGGKGATGAEDSSRPDAVAPEDAPPVEDTEPVLIGEKAETVPYDELRLPIEMEPLIVVDPGWTGPPQQLSGVLVAYAEEDDALRFRVVDQDGTVLWEARRPLSCSAIALTRHGDDDLLVLADADTGADGFTTTLTAYDLRDATAVWGPVEVPGPQAAPGLVHASTEDRPMGTGPRIALAAADGDVLLDEADLDGGRILAEHLGTVLWSDDTHLHATGPDGDELWSETVPDGLDAKTLRVLDPIHTATSWAVLVDGSAAGVALDLETGSLVAEDALAIVHDPVTEMTAVAQGSTVRGLDADGDEAWVHEDKDALRLVSAGERLVYAVRQGEGSLVVLDAEAGLMVQPYDADRNDLPPAMPELFTKDVAAVIRSGERRLLVTTEFDPEFGQRA